MNHTDPTAETRVAEARRAVHESLILLPAWEADRVRALIADLETAVEFRAASAVVSPPTSRAELRKAVARAIHRYDNHHALSGNDVPSEHHYGEADAVLAVLPEPTSRAAVLLDAAALLDQRATGIDAFASSDYGPEAEAVRALADAANELRRLAAEAQQQPDTETPVVDRAAVLREAADDLATAFGDPMVKHIGAIAASHLRRRAREIEAGETGEEQTSRG